MWELNFCEWWLLGGEMSGTKVPDKGRCPFGAAGWGRTKKSVLWGKLVGGRKERVANNSYFNIPVVLALSAGFSEFELPFFQEQSGRSPGNCKSKMPERFHQEAV